MAEIVAEFTIIDMPTGFDSEEVQQRVLQELKPDLGKHKGNERIVDWLSAPPGERFDLMTVREVITDMMDEIDPERLLLQDEEARRLLVRQSALNRFNLQVQKPESEAVRLFENAKNYGLQQALKDNKLEAYLREKGFSSYALDYAVSKVVIEEVIGYLTQV